MSYSNAYFGLQTKSTSDSGKGLETKEPGSAPTARTGSATAVAVASTPKAIMLRRESPAAFFGRVLSASSNVCSCMSDVSERGFCEHGV
eukprot:20734-Heterococcus_DN1.PRE.1